MHYTYTLYNLFPIAGIVYLEESSQADGIIFLKGDLLYKVSGSYLNFDFD